HRARARGGRRDPQARDAGALRRANDAASGESARDRIARLLGRRDRRRATACLHLHEADVAFLSAMASLQVWIVAMLSKAHPVAAVMRMHWSWPAAESIHFIGLSLLVGCVGLFDLRLLGVGRGIPIAAFHK